MSAQDKSAAEIEREVAECRARVAETLERIDHKLSPAEMIDGTIGYLRRSGAVNGAADFGRNLAATVRDNPLPVVLMSAGLGWLMLSANREPSHDGAQHRPAHLLPSPEASRRAGELAEAGKGKASEGIGALRDKGIAAKRRSAEAIDGAREGLSHARDRILRGARGARGGLEDVRYEVEDTLADARDAVVDAGQRVGRMYRQQVDQHPVAVAAAAFAIGAAIAAALPRTRREDELLGAQADAVKERAREEAHHQAENVRAVAGAAYGAAREEAEEQNLTPEAGKHAGEAVKEKVARVGAAAMDATKREAEERFSQQGDDNKGSEHPPRHGGGSMGATP